MKRILFSLLLGSLLGCGTNSSRNNNLASDSPSKERAIVGGSLVSKDDPIAHQMALVWINGGICSASILDNSHVLTAAHCVKNATINLNIVFGINPLKTSLNKDITSIEIHERYKDFENDLAVVTFSAGLPAGFYPATLLSEIPRDLVAGHPITLAGYGRTGLTKTSKYGDLMMTQTYFSQWLYNPPNLFVTSSPGHSICYGDSGGPSFYAYGGRYYQIGINEASDDCAGFSVFTSVAHNAAWIKARVPKAKFDSIPNCHYMWGGCN